jgi:hypothetical protein
MKAELDRVERLKKRKRRKINKNRKAQHVTRRISGKRSTA